MTKQICIPVIYVSMISTFISVIEFVELTVAVKLMSLKPYDRKYFSVVNH